MNNKSVRRFFYKYSGLKGFTLIELLVVIGILGILAAVLLAMINPIAQLQKSNDARRKGDLESVQRALEMYYQDKGTYPLSNNSNHEIKVGATTYAWGQPWTVNGQNYMAKLPVDPVQTQNYVYYSAGGQSYYLYTSLQRGIYDPQICFPTTGAACSSARTNGVATACGGGATCNYGVSSPNVTP